MEIHLDYDSGPGDPVAGQQPRAIIDHGILLGVIDKHFLAALRGAPRIAVSMFDRLSIHDRGLALHHCAQVDHSRPELSEAAQRRLGSLLQVLPYVQSYQLYDRTREEYRSTRSHE